GKHQSPNGPTSRRGGSPPLSLCHSLAGFREFVSSLFGFFLVFERNTIGGGDDFERAAAGGIIKPAALVANHHFGGVGFPLATIGDGFLCSVIRNSEAWPSGNHRHEQSDAVATQFPAAS